MVVAATKYGSKEISRVHVLLSTSPNSARFRLEMSVATAFNTNNISAHVLGVPRLHAGVAGRDVELQCMRRVVSGLSDLTSHRQLTPWPSLYLCREQKQSVESSPECSTKFTKASPSSLHKFIK